MTKKHREPENNVRRNNKNNEWETTTTTILAVENPQPDKNQDQYTKLLILGATIGQSTFTDA